jgi:hypothetical protein
MNLKNKRKQVVNRLPSKQMGGSQFQTPILKKQKKSKQTIPTNNNNKTQLKDTQSEDNELLGV